MKRFKQYICEQKWSDLINKYNNNHLGSNEEEISNTLHSNQPNLSNSDMNNVKEFTGLNYNSINRKLINSSVNTVDKKSILSKFKKDPNKLTNREKEINDSVSKAANNKIGHDVHLFSGVNFDPQKIAKQNKNNTIPLSYNMSFSHDPKTAKNFAVNNNALADVHHVIHLNAKASNKGYHVGQNSKYGNSEGAEHETIIPSGSKLKYTHSEVSKFGSSNIRMHHFDLDN